MFAINHAATALVIKKRYPQVPMGWLLLSVQLTVKWLLLVILVFNLANFSFFSTELIGPEALLANQPLVLTSIVFIQIVLTLALVGCLSRRRELFQTSFDPVYCR